MPGLRVVIKGIGDKMLSGCRCAKLDLKSTLCAIIGKVVLNVISMSQVTRIEL